MVSERGVVGEVPTDSSMVMCSPVSIAVYKRRHMGREIIFTIEMLHVQHACCVMSVC